MEGGGDARGDVGGEKCTVCANIFPGLIELYWHMDAMHPDVKKVRADHFCFTVKWIHR